VDGFTAVVGGLLLKAFVFGRGCEAGGLGGGRLLAEELEAGFDGRGLGELVGLQLVGGGGLEG